MADPLMKLVKKYEKAGNFKGIVDIYNFVIADTDPVNKSNIAKCQLNIARAYNKMGEYAKAEQEYQKSLSYEDSGEIRYEMCFTQLNQRNLVDGFTNYGHRWDIKEMELNRFHIDNKLLLHVQDWKHIIGQRVMVVSEQGYGDEILFSRALKPALEITKKIGYCAKKELLELFKYNYPDIEYTVNEEFIKPEANDYIHDNYDCIMTIGDLFRAYVIEFGEAPPINILTTKSPNKPSTLSNFSGNEVSRDLIGYVFSAGNQGDNGHLRSIPEGTLRFLDKEFDILNFQMGQKTSLGIPMKDHIRDFYDTAFLLNGVGTVVTVDTAFAHLALNLGKKTVILYNKFIDWRWKNDLYTGFHMLSINDPKFRDKLLKILID